MVHLSPVERVGLLPRASISIDILQLRTIIGVVSSLPALVTGDMAQVLLSGCGWVGMVLAVASSISIPILHFRALSGIVPSLLALETSNVT